jgi:hypothetical protein
MTNESATIVRYRFSVANEIEKELDQTLEWFERLRHIVRVGVSILKSALEGRLVGREEVSI